MAPDSTPQPTTKRPSATVADRDVPRDDGAVETDVPTVDRVSDHPDRQPRAARLHALVLEARVAALEQRLEHKERQLEEIRSQYEAVLSRREGADTPDGDGGFAWPPWK